MLKWDGVDTWGEEVKPSRTIVLQNYKDVSLTFQSWRFAINLSTKEKGFQKNPELWTYIYLDPVTSEPFRDYVTSYVMTSLPVVKV
ncbi:hypothetical protein AVEN_13106-1 [Araneus ventricosus]|uniref:Uncharacterized protein n=1 Tax=Araneus ventricosus TaxID=182803 RepID=A0A4Y2K9U1_ARAVE|nr:hypothetical protein AVEN_13106-1 [Araneus ventricosus]